MKAFAEFKEKDGQRYRLNTLLQFGDSWEHIGNIVLANPGSAKEKEPISEITSSNISKFYNNFENRFFNDKDWYECDPDPTMHQVEKVFNGWYVNPSEPLRLNGVVQLFNVFNIREQDLTVAIAELPADNDFLFSKGIESFFNDKPTYFGFSKAVLNNETLNPIAKSIFNDSTPNIKNIYKSDFDKNSFYHLGYVNRAYHKEHFKRYKNEVLKPLFNLVQEQNKFTMQ